MKPIIGIVTCGISDQRQFVSSPYIKAIEESGGLPVLLPFLTSALTYDHSKLGSYTAFCDGFLFCGGDDINPILFGQELFFGSGRTDYQFDRYQISLMQQVLETKKPVLAICRGIQILNVACGGTIYQDISLQPGSPFNHMQNASLRSDISHDVTFTPETLIFDIIGDHAYTNSYHHQTIAETGDGLTVSGKTSDGTIEALEIPGHPFAIGVQWHPECMYDTSGKMRRLFHSFLKASESPS